MLIVHIKSTKDTEDFSCIYENIKGKILINPSRSNLEKELEKEKDRIVFIGHGTEYGLLDSDLEHYLLDGCNVNLLKNKIIVGVWCYAGNFAGRYDLKGFFTSNFISNMEELISSGLCISKESEYSIRSENIKFSKKLNKLLLNNVELENWKEELRKDMSNFSFVQYNHEAFYIDV